MKKLLIIILLFVSFSLSIVYAEDGADAKDFVSLKVVCDRDEIGLNNPSAKCYLQFLGAQNNYYGIIYTFKLSSGANAKIVGNDTLKYISSTPFSAGTELRKDSNTYIVIEATSLVQNDFEVQVQVQGLYNFDSTKEDNFSDTPIDVSTYDLSAPAGRLTVSAKDTDTNDDNEQLPEQTPDPTPAPEEPKEDPTPSGESSETGVNDGENVESSDGKTPSKTEPEPQVQQPSADVTRDEVKKNPNTGNYLAISVIGLMFFGGCLVVFTTGLNSKFIR